MAETCKTCNGRGFRANINIPMAVITFGISALVDWADEDVCGHCHGYGYFKTPSSTQDPSR